MDDKIYLDSDTLTRDSFRLARRIYDSGWVPDMIIALWRGGTPIGITVHEFLDYKGIDCYHTVVKTMSYTGIGEHGEPVVENLDYVLEKLTPESKVLVVDDIFDSGKTAEVMQRALSKATPHIRFAMIYFKPNKNQTALTPDYYLKETDSWLVFPHELMGLTPDEIRRKDPCLCELLELQ